MQRPGLPTRCRSWAIVAATRRLDAKLIGVAVGRGDHALPTEQMLRLATDSDSVLVDENGQRLPPGDPE